ALPPEDVEGVGHRRPRALACVPLAPSAPREVSGKLEAGPGGRLPKADDAKELTALFLLRYPHAGAFELPVAHGEGHVAPGPAAVPGRAVADEARNVRVGIEGGVVFEVAAADTAQA